MKNIEVLISYLEHFSYLGIFLFLLMSGYAIPVPEEVILMAAGYTSSAGFTNIFVAILISLTAILAGDMILFELAQGNNKYIQKLKIKFNESRFTKNKYFSSEHIGRTIFFFRFVIGLRFFSPFLAATSKTKRSTFLFFDILALIIYVPFFILLGFYFHNSLLLAITGVESIRHIIFIITLIITGALIIKFAKKPISLIK